MSEPENLRSGSGLTAAQEYLEQLWDEHVRYEFATQNTEDTLECALPTGDFSQKFSTELSA